MQDNKYEELLARINKDLPTLPSIVTPLLNLVLDKNSSVKEISKIVKLDQTITCKILKVVNSAAFGLQTKISDPEHALTILGYDSFKNLLLSLSVFEIIENGEDGYFNKLFFWRHSLAVATVSKKIASLTNYENPNEAYVAGLLHDIGKLIIDQTIPDKYTNYLKRLTQNPNLSLQFEEEKLLLNHALVGKFVLEKWNFPTSLQKALELHHGIKHPAKNIPLLAAIIHVADFTCWTQAIGSFDFFIHPSLDPQMEQMVDLKNLPIDTVLEEMEKELKVNARIFNFKLSNFKDFRFALQKANLELGKINFLYEEIKKNQDKKIRELNALSNVIYEARKVLEPSCIIKSVVEKTKENFHLRGAIWFSVDTNKKRMTLQGKCGKFPNNLPLLSIGCAWTDDIGIILYTSVLNKSIMHITDNDKKSNPHQILLKSLKSREIILVPISIEQKITDLLLLDNTDKELLFSPDTIQLFNIMAQNLGMALENAKLLKHVSQMATIDPLTNIYNRRQLDFSLLNEINRSIRSKLPFSVVIFDIDFFKTINDNHGHQIGDIVLKDIASILKKNVRNIDIVGRLGGDEFLAILPNTTLQNTIPFVERIRRIVEKYGQIRQQNFPGCQISVSVGVTEFNSALDDSLRIINRADKALYQSKNKGRNRISILKE